MTILVAVTGAFLLAGYGAFVWYTNSVERPDYVTVVTDGDIELRDYPALIVAEVARSGDRRRAINEGFRSLAAYIFASDRAGDKIAMTAPVTQTPAPVDGAWTIRFVMPASHTLQSLPAPARPDVRLASLPDQRRAAIRFSGVADEALIAEKEQALRAWMTQRGLETSGPPSYAFYNHPATPGFLRRNEILFDLAAGDPMR